MSMPDFSGSNPVRMEGFLRRAIALSRQGSEAGDGGPFGAVVVRGDEIIGEGWNRVIARNDPTAHGEIEAIREACRRVGNFSLEGCDLYTSAEPCPMCLAAIYWARLDRVIYAASASAAAALGFGDVSIGRQVCLAPSERSIPSLQILENEALAVFRDFASRPDRARY